MTSNEILKADVLDILFDNRNKQYGAYVLRKHYNKRLSLALGVSLSAVLLSFFLFRTDSGTTNLPNKPVVEITALFIPPDPITKPKEIVRAKEPVPPRQQQFTKFVIKPDDLVKKNVADQNTLMNSLISKITLDGRDPKPGEIPVIKDPVLNNGGGGKKETKFVPEEREPEFPGGKEAWINFLRKNLVAPSELQVDEKKTVMVRFLVAEDGAVTGFEVIQSGGRSFDNEVIRVLKKMPKWKPAIQNGEAVAKAYMQPVTFVGVEQ